MYNFPEHDLRQTKSAKRFKHCAKRFKERYGRRLSVEEHYAITGAIRKGLCEHICDLRSGGKILQMEWNDRTIYPLIGSGVGKNLKVFTYLSADMVFTFIAGNAIPKLEGKSRGKFFTKHSTEMSINES